MKLSLFGASGRTGRRVLALALARGDRVRALVRDPASLMPHSALNVRTGDALDASAVSGTLKGTDAIVIALGMRDIAAPSTDFSDSVRNVVDSARSAGVRRIVAIASAGVLPDAAGGLRNRHGTSGPYRHVNAEHTRNYETLRDSGLDWTLMCPVDLKDDIPQGHARTMHEDLPAGGTETGYDDLAATMLGLIGERASYGKRVGIVSLRAMGDASRSSRKPNS